jgi:hypothetical protein
MDGNLPTRLQNQSLDYSSSSQTAHGAEARKRLLIASLITLALWFVPYSDYLLYPLRLFVTFIHESGHALATLASGGRVVSLTISPDGSGLTQSYLNPAWAWLTLSGGYLGTTIFGALLLQVDRLHSRHNAGRKTLYVAGGFLILVTLLWSWSSLFTIVSGLALGALLIVMGRYLSPKAADFVASFLAVQCCLNALGDLRILLHITTQGAGHNDAAFMAQNYGLSPVVWSVTWGLMALTILALALRSYWRATAAR